jgi:hypothetical protein
MKNWKTSLTGIAVVAIFCITYFKPQYKDFCNNLFVLLVGYGFLSAKDHNVTGGTKEQ